jgi:periplasmic protein CpxP/Spy
MLLVRLVMPATLVLFMTLAAHAQQQPPGAPGDEIAQLGELIGLTEEQQTEIRGLMEEVRPEIEQLQMQAQLQQQELQRQVGPEYDESEIREAAERLGTLTGEMTALSVLLQSKIQAVFTDEQRAQLEQLVQQQQQQQQFEEQLQRQQIE